jgi:16S rRNA (guanine527-N7)-methyltransferase
VTSSEFRERLLARAQKAGISITADEQVQLETYFRLLARWNLKINLTSLPLSPPTDQTFDRLLIEPFAAAGYMDASASRWFDVGSGGGSPAIPLKIAHPRAKLTMIESRSRKAAFLTEAVRALTFRDVGVESERFGELVRRIEPRSVDMITVRAVRSSQSLFKDLHHVLSSAGRVFMFHSAAPHLEVPSGFSVVKSVRLGTGGDARLSILHPVFHVEQSS